MKPLASALRLLTTAWTFVWMVAGCVAVAVFGVCLMLSLGLPASRKVLGGLSKALDELKAGS